jgi:hypothetical protein
MSLSVFFVVRSCFGLVCCGRESALVQFAGLRLTTVSHASLIVGTLPMLLALSSALFLHERLKVVESGALLGSGLGALLISFVKDKCHHRSTANIKRRPVGFYLNVGGGSVDPDHETADGEI